jgi:hypothetical protein
VAYALARVLVAIDGIHRFFSPVRTCIRKSVFSEFQRPIPSSILVINWPLLLFSADVTGNSEDPMFICLYGDKRSVPTEMHNKLRLIA